MGDYVAGFIGVSEGNAFGLDAFSPIKLNDGSVVTRGQGNHCSVEFNMLYRVCTILSVYDSILSSRIYSGIPRRLLPMKNGQRTFSRRFLGGSPPIRSGLSFLPSRAALLTNTQITMDDFDVAADRVFGQFSDPKDREFGGYIPLLLRRLLLFS